MTTFASALLGAAALTVAAFGAAQPAQARNDVGVFFSPHGLSISVDRNRNYCSDYWFRRDHPYQCNQYNNGGFGYGQAFYGHPQYNYGNDDRRFHQRDQDNRRASHNDGNGWHQGERDHAGDNHRH